MTFHFRCPDCNLTDLVLIGDAKDWECPHCHLNKLDPSKKEHSDDIYRLEQIILSVERLNHSCEDNMKRLNSMMNELKGLIAMVRPNAKKNAWYGTEVESKCENLKIKDVMSIELKD